MQQTSENSNYKTSKTEVFAKNTIHQRNFKVLSHKTSKNRGCHESNENQWEYIPLKIIRKSYKKWYVDPKSCEKLR